jgi:glycosyltransferase involved in cell wall biosynthesis
MNKAVSGPLISIITACLNQIEFVSEAIESVLNQDYPNVEHIIIDGGSTDGTLDILSSYPHLYVVSETDRGVYDAWNKGLKLAKGQLVGFLNADDFYQPKVFTEIVQAFSVQTGIEALMGKTIVFQQDASGEKETLLISSTCPPEKLLYQVTLSRMWINAWFFSKDMINRLMGFNPVYQLSGDREFLFRMAMTKVVYGTLEKIIYHYRQHLGSLTFSNRDDMYALSLRENLQIAEKCLKNRETREDIYQVCRGWHNRRSLDLAAFYWRNRDYSRTMYYLYRGMRYDGAWPLYLLRSIFYKPK